MIRRVEPLQIVLFRGSKSRNKVSVGEPADGSLDAYCVAQRSGVGVNPRYEVVFVFYTLCELESASKPHVCDDSFVCMKVHQPPTNKTVYFWT